TLLSPAAVSAESLLRSTSVRRGQEGLHETDPANNVAAWCFQLGVKGVSSGSSSEASERAGGFARGLLGRLKRGLVRGSSTPSMCTTDHDECCDNGTHDESYRSQNNYKHVAMVGVMVNVHSVWKCGISIGHMSDLPGQMHDR